MKRLKTLNDIRRFLSTVTNQLDSGEITEGKARCFGYLCSVLSQIVKDSDLENRVAKLEEEFGKKSIRGQK